MKARHKRAKREAQKARSRGFDADQQPNPNDYTQSLVTGFLGGQTWVAERFSKTSESDPENPK